MVKKKKEVIELKGRNLFRSPPPPPLSSVCLFREEFIDGSKSDCFKE